MDTLRGTHGPDFEGYAVIKRGDDGGIDCGCFGGGKDSKEKLVLVKGPFAFVFTNEFDDAPKYAMALANLKPVSKGSHGSSYLVTLETNLGDVEYEFSFEKEALAKEFVEAVEKQAAIGLNEQIRKVCIHVFRIYEAEFRSDSHTSIHLMIKSTATRSRKFAQEGEEHQVCRKSCHEEN